MAKAPLSTYLRTHRKRSGFSQREIAFLLAFSSRATVSRHEATRRPPTFEQAFAYEVLFGAPASSLFPGEYEKARALVIENARELLEALMAKPESPSRDQRVKFLEVLIRRVQVDNDTMHDSNSF